MDYGPGSRTHDGMNRYHLWDYDDSDHKPHPLSLLPEPITSIETTGDHFEPSEFVTWSPNWIHPRDWGKYS